MATEKTWGGQHNQRMSFHRIWWWKLCIFFTTVEHWAVPQVFIMKRQPFWMENSLWQWYKYWEETLCWSRDPVDGRGNKGPGVSVEWGGQRYWQEVKQAWRMGAVLIHDLRRNSGELGGVCLLHDAAGDSLLSVHNSNKASRAFRWGVEQQAEARRNILVISGDHRILLTTHQPQRQVLPSKILLTSSSVSSACGWLSVHSKSHSSLK